MISVMIFIFNIQGGNELISFIMGFEIRSGKVRVRVVDSRPTKLLTGVYINKNMLSKKFSSRYSYFFVT